MKIQPDREAAARPRPVREEVGWGWMADLRIAGWLTPRAADELWAEKVALSERLVVLERERDALKAAERSHYKTAIENMHKLEAAEVRVARLEEALRHADDLLRRLAEWDMLHVSPDGKAATGDAPYWQAEIARAREALEPQE